MDKALELADILENRCEEHQLNASYMLRQQKVEIDRLTMLCDCMTTESNRKGNEIEELKQIIDANNLSQNIGRFVKAANEPVAYIDPYDLERLPHYDCHIGSQQLKNGIPLYTHPVKELTDEEIWDFINALFLDMGDYWELTERNAIPMIRAILRKASEK